MWINPWNQSDQKSFLSFPSINPSETTSSVASVEIDDVVHGNQMSTVTTLPIVTTIPNDCDYEIDVCSKEGEWLKADCIVNHLQSLRAHLNVTIQNAMWKVSSTTFTDYGGSRRSQNTNTRSKLHFLTLVTKSTQDVTWKIPVETSSTLSTNINRNKLAYKPLPHCSTTLPCRRLYIHHSSESSKCSKNDDSHDEEEIKIGELTITLDIFVPNFLFSRGNARGTGCWSWHAWSDDVVGAGRLSDDERSDCVDIYRLLTDWYRYTAQPFRLIYWNQTKISSDKACCFAYCFRFGKICGNCPVKSTWYSSCIKLVMLNFFFFGAKCAWRTATELRIERRCEHRVIRTQHLVWTLTELWCWSETNRPVLMHGDRRWN